MFDDFLNFIQKGPENYYETLKKIDVLNELSESYIKNPFGAIQNNFDEKGVFTSNIFKPYILCDKTFDEEPLTSFNHICNVTFNNNPFKLEITFVFDNFQKISYTISNQTEPLLSSGEINSLWDKYHYVAGNYLEITHNGHYSKKYFEHGFRYKEELIAKLLNDLLEKSNLVEKRRWISGINGYYFFINPTVLKIILKHNLIAPKEYYYHFF